MTRIDPAKLAASTTNYRVARRSGGPFRWWLPGEVIPPALRADCRLATDEEVALIREILRGNALDSPEGERIMDEAAQKLGPLLNRPTAGDTTDA